MSPPIIEAEDVTRIYQSQAVQVRALDGVSLRVNKGEVVAVMGASGSGKTTLLNCLAGLDTIDSGKILIAGQDLAELSEHEMTNFRAANMGFVFQTFNLLPVLTAVENVELPLLIARRSPTEARHRAQTLLSEVGLARRMQHYPGELSGGQRQRVAIARALIHDPTILWADEPTGSLDSDASQEIMDLLRAVNRTHGQTIVLVTHAQEIGAQVDRVIHMHDGRVME
ncbi:MAG TPA: ABC transporter ATP-binding protein [Ktedonobacterales bacterium]|nr:ABC transporter ATP-binding protein [Ktedonobacterales bacterium]